MGEFTSIFLARGFYRVRQNPFANQCGKTTSG